MKTTLREITLRFVYHPSASRIAALAVMFAMLLLQPMGPISGGGGSV